MAAVGEGRRRTVAEDIRRAPQQDGCAAAGGGINATHFPHPPLRGTLSQERVIAEGGLSKAPAPTFFHPIFNFLPLQFRKAVL